MVPVTKAHRGLSPPSYRALPGAHEKAMADCDSAIRLDPSNPLHYSAKAITCEKLGRVEEARTAYEKVISLAGARDLPYVKDARERLKQLSSARRKT